MKMEKLTDSDAAMVAYENFENILSSIRNSCLNYSIQASPFSAIVSIKKTMIKDKDGFYMIPERFKENKSDYRSEVLALEQKLIRLRSEHEEIMSAFASAKEEIASLQQMVCDRDNVIQELINTNQVEKEAANNGDKLFKNNVSSEKEESLIFTSQYNKVPAYLQDLGQDENEHRDLVETYTKLSNEDESSSSYTCFPDIF